MTLYEQKTMEEIQKALAAKTPTEFIKWKPTNLRKEGDTGFSALAFAHADARFFQNRLDDVVGTFNWQSAAEVVGGLLLVKIAIRHPKIGEWVWKADTGQVGEDDSGGFGGGKGLFSGGFKRVGYQWGIARDLYDLPTPRCRCKGWEKNNRINFRGWIENPWAKAESRETERLHPSQVEAGSDADPTEPSVDYIPANSTTFYALAYTKLKIEREQAKDVLQPFIDKSTGEIDYGKAITLLEKNLPDADRDFTNQQAEVAKKESAGG